MLFWPIAENLTNATSLRRFSFLRVRLSVPAAKPAAAREKKRQTPGERVIANFRFATGIENSIPTINHGKTRID